MNPDNEIHMKSAKVCEQISMKCLDEEYMDA